MSDDNKKSKLDTLFAKDETQLTLDAVIPKRKRIVEPVNMQDLLRNSVTQKAVEKNTIVEKAKRVRVRKEKPIHPESIPEEKYDDVNAEIKEEIEEVSNVVIPEEVDVIETEYEINQAMIEIPQVVNIDDLEFTKIEKKSKAGYYKCKVNWKKNDIPEQLNIISSYVKKHSKGLISPRLCDIRVIANTNKTQLRNSQIKLGPITVVFKPDHNKLKVNKGTRFMISIPEDFNSSKNIIVYIQESRKKHIMEITQKDFTSSQHFNEFIGDRIAEYYIVGYDVAYEKLRLRTTNNPLMDVIDKVVKTHDYKAKPFVEDETHIYAVDIISTSNKNQWLYVRIEEADIKGTYRIFARKHGDDSFIIQLGSAESNKFTFNELMDSILTYLKKCYDKDWSDQLKIDDKHDSYYHYATLLKYRHLKEALIEFESIELDLDNEIGLDIKSILTRKDHEKEGRGNMAAETILGVTKQCKFSLSYLLLPIPGGDSRTGRDYITSQDYYKKTGVKDRNPYQMRKNTILMKEGNQRKYNNGVNVFQLDYIVGNDKYKYIAKTFEEIKQKTGFLTENIKTPTNGFPDNKWYE